MPDMYIQVDAFSIFQNIDKHIYVYAFSSNANAILSTTTMETRLSSLNIVFDHRALIASVVISLMASKPLSLVIRVAFNGWAVAAMRASGSLSRYCLRKAIAESFISRVASITGISASSFLSRISSCGVREG